MSSLKHVGSSTTVAEPGRSEFPSFGWWVSVAAVAFGVCAVLALVSVVLSVVAAAVFVSGVVAWSDVVWRRIPNGVLLVASVFVVVVGAAWSGARLEAVLVAAGLTCLPALVLHLVNPRWVGFGDVKLLAVMGGLLGLVWVLAGLLALWLAMVLAVVSHAFVPAAWRDEVPFGFWLSLCAVPVSIFSAGSIVS